MSASPWTIQETPTSKYSPKWSKLSQSRFLPHNLLNYQNLTHSISSKTPPSRPPRTPPPPIKPHRPHLPSNIKVNLFQSTPSPSSINKKPLLPHPVDPLAQHRRYPQSPSQPTSTHNLSRPTSSSCPGIGPKLNLQPYRPLFSNLGAVQTPVKNPIPLLLPRPPTPQPPPSLLLLVLSLLSPWIATHSAPLVSTSTHPFPLPVM